MFRKCEELRTEYCTSVPIAPTNSCVKFDLTAYVGKMEQDFNKFMGDDEVTTKHCRSRMTNVSTREFLFMLEGNEKKLWVTRFCPHLDPKHWICHSLQNKTTAWGLYLYSLPFFLSFFLSPFFNLFVCGWSAYFDLDGLISGCSPEAPDELSWSPPQSRGLPPHVRQTSNMQINVVL